MLPGSRSRILAAAGGLVLVPAVVVLVLVTGRAPSAEQASPSTGAFPREVAGLPVLTVARASDVLASGKADGQAIAVAGFYNAVFPSCPSPGRYIGPLERWCEYSAFTDLLADARLCEHVGSNEIDCHQATGTNLAPFFMPETSGSAQAWLTGGPLNTDEPAALVLIGHAGDPRQWQCTDMTKDECARAFVVDRIAWAEGDDVPVTVPETSGVGSGAPITARMTLAEVATAAGAGDDLVTAAPFRAGDVATVDPRWTLAGDSLVWVVRSLDRDGAPLGAATMPEKVQLVDDTTGKALGSLPLQLDPAYRPARLWPTATVHGADCCAGNDLPFVRVRSGDGTVVSEGLVSGGSGGDEFTTYGGGYGSTPIVLPAGRYTIDSWLATDDRGVMGAPKRQCSTEVTLAALDDAAPNADFPAGRACTFRAAPPSPAGS